ncbi:LysR substrate-binding domain-containing protein [Paenibacillus catalpae]|uniref:LysR substrate-binding domain-containing protein n=1 Tax=Paenibacillus catalpae TaxID=1045775 RepID=UPI003CCC3E46
MTFESDEVATAAGLVAAGLGVSLLANTAFNKDKIAKVRLHEPNCQRSIGLASIEGRYLSPVALKFKQFIVDYFERNQL